MKNIILLGLILSLCCLPLFAAIFPKTGTASMQFLKIGIDARAIGMGEAYTSVSDDISSVYWNPAGLALKDERQLMLSHTNWVAETYYESFAYSMPTDLGYFAISSSFFYSGEMYETIEETFSYTGRTFTFSDLAVGLTYANAMTDQFSFGITAKYLREDVADENMTGYSVDLGTLYNTNWKNVTIGMALRNFGPNVSYNVEYEKTSGPLSDVDKSGTEAKLPMNFSLGIAGDIFREDDSYLVGSVQLDNCVDREETWNLGAEYNISNLFLRGGYQIGYDAASFTGGFGVKVATRIAVFNIDYAYTHMGRLQEDFLTAAHRLSMKLAF